MCKTIYEKGCVNVFRTKYESRVISVNAARRVEDEKINEAIRKYKKK